MSIVASDIKVYGSASMPDDDTTTAIGGAIDTTKKVEFTDISPTGTVQAVSSAAGDMSQTLTITGRDATGVLITESKQLNGTTPVSFTSSFERILKAVLSGAATGTVTISETVGGGQLITFEPGILQVRRPFYNAVAPDTGTRKYYEKVFFKNTHGSLSLTETKIKKTSDPSGKIAFALETSLNGTGTNGTGNNRQVAPAGLTFDSNDKSVANNGNHTAGAGQGVWLELTLGATDPSLKSSYTIQEIGVTA